MMAADATNSTLDDESLVMLLEEVSAMVAAERPLLAGLVDLEGGFLRKLRRAAREVRKRVEQGQPVPKAIAGLSNRYNTLIRVAMELMAATASVEPIHEAVRQINEANERRRQLRYAMINPLLNVIIAACIAFFVVPRILVAVSNSELIKSAFAPTIQEIWMSFARNFALAAFVTIAVIVVFSTVIYCVNSVSQKRSRTVLHQAIFCRWLALQIEPKTSAPIDRESTLELGSVLAAAAEVVSPKFSNDWQDVIESVRGGAISPDSLGIPTQTPDAVRSCIADLVSGSRSSASIAYDLRQLSELYRHRALRNQYWLSELTPRWIAWGVMGLVLFILLRTILIPLADLAAELLH